MENDEQEGHTLGDVDASGPPDQLIIEQFDGVHLPPLPERDGEESHEDIGL
ncbi:hypothetical protein [Halorientalis salina]|uniref:hypothetical protein n=1 Tax=Halorientalis salina TaxID=2932266 RepID=UPI00145F737C|nr:hypothetical protein [Halorientalis salina]